MKEAFKLLWMLVSGPFKEAGLFRNSRLKLYKQRKVIQEKTRFNRNYLFSFKIKVRDEGNPQVFEKELQMMVPGKAAFFAKRKLLEALMRKLEVDIIDVNVLSEDDASDFEKQKEKYIFEKNKENG